MTISRHISFKDKDRTVPAHMTLRANCTQGLPAAIGSFACLFAVNTGIEMYVAVGLIFVLFGCDAWSVSLREEHRVRANREVTGLEKTA
jgi:hypothetical protein